MQFISDVLLGAGALGAAFYCLVLARRLNRFNQLETGMGGAIAVLSAQVDDMTRALAQARLTAGESAASLEALTARAGEAARRLELLLASMHDLPEQGREETVRRAKYFRKKPRTEVEPVLEAAE